jgi:hypothetical protein
MHIWIKIIGPGYKQRIANNCIAQIDIPKYINMFFTKITILKTLDKDSTEHKKQKRDVILNIETFWFLSFVAENVPFVVEGVRTDDAKRENVLNVEEGRVRKELHVIN